jgi:molybdenum cofactor cytidylyltransferase
MQIACAMLAAGGSQRLGEAKQLLYRGDRTLVRATYDAVSGGGCEPIAVIVGAHAERVMAALAGVALARIDNPEWATGIASSIQRALAWAAAIGCEALLLTGCDQPALSGEHVAALCERVRRGASAAASGYAGITGAPAVFTRAWFERLESLRGDRGAGALLRGTADVEVIAWPEGADDVDTDADVVRLGLRRDPTVGR